MSLPSTDYHQGELLQSRLKQLWKSAHLLVATHPQLSQTWIRHLMRLAASQKIVLSNSFYWNVCSCCGLYWFGGRPDRLSVRLIKYSHLRAQMRVKSRDEHLQGSEKAHGGTRSQPSSYRLMSQMMRKEEGSTMKPQKSDRSQCYFLVYECRGCGLKSIFDAHPHTTSGPTPDQPSSEIPIQKTTTVSPASTSSQNHKKKVSQLQKILQRSSQGNSGQSKSPSLSSLGSFLTDLQKDNKK